jgi:hypothetical protein
MKNPTMVQPRTKTFTKPINKTSTILSRLFFQGVREALIKNKDKLKCTSKLTEPVTLDGEVLPITTGVRLQGSVTLTADIFHSFKPTWLKKLLVLFVLRGVQRSDKFKKNLIDRLNDQVLKEDYFPLTTSPDIIDPEDWVYLPRGYYLDPMAARFDLTTEFDLFINDMAVVDDKLTLHLTASSMWRDLPIRVNER